MNYICWVVCSLLIYFPIAVLSIVLLLLLIARIKILSQTVWRQI